MSTLLDVRGLDAGYGDFQALFGVDLTVREGEVVAVIGANGAGKSTLLGAIAGLVEVRAGEILHRGEPITGLPAEAVVRRGIALVPEGRRLFPSLSVEENLRLAAALGRPGPWDLDAVYALFPVLRERRDIPATALSGGQQQMCAIARGLLTNPELLLLDEASLGLAPAVIREIYATVPRLREQGITLVVVEQDIGQALQVADRVCCLQEGRVTLEGRPAELGRERIREAYFGTAA
ncbi:High-affinity branched-chain amino acid transport ATP-binding protein LivF [bacterium HR39]|nr:High-affinity branched-chain amino acid transport ATP-binding protein LivF [bacterium HR39]